MSSSNMFVRLFAAKPRTVRHAPRTTRLAVMDLELRSLMAASLTATLDLADGLLRVEGTDDADQIRIVQQDGSVAIDGIPITVTDLDGNVSDLDAVDRNSVGWALVDALGGDDTFVMDTSGVVEDSLFAVNVYGGDGDDWLQGGGTTEALFGQAGDDYLDGGAAHDLVYGGEGDDTIAGGDGDDFLAGEWGTDSVSGGAGDDSIYGGDDADVLSGDEGNDTIYGEAGDDQISGVDGNDSAYGGDGTDALYGGDGDDFLAGENGEDTLYGEAGDDVMTGAFDGSQAEEGSYADALHGGDGNDDLAGGYGDDFLDGGAGDDVMNGGYANDFLEGGDGNDALTGENGTDTFVGGFGNDTVSGGDQDDVVYAGWGKDRVYGGDGNDSLYGQEDDDFLAGESGNDFLSGGDGNDAMTGAFETSQVEVGSYQDTLYGGNGNDNLAGGYGDDVLYGESGNDGLNGGYANDYLDGGDGADTMFGENGTDRLYGGAGNDDLSGGYDSDFLAGGDGNDRMWGAFWDSINQRPGAVNDDTLYGGFGDDYLVGGDGSDSLFGEGGNDYVYGNTGNDRMYGQEGNDYLDGGNGQDVVNGGNHTDTLHGGAGEDQLNGDGGADDLYGDAGDDALIAVDAVHADRLWADAGRDTLWVDEVSAGLGTTASVTDTMYGVDGTFDRVQRVRAFANGADRSLDGDAIADPAATIDPFGNSIAANYRNFRTNPLFADAGPRRTDIVQQNRGDCWIMCTAAGTADRSPWNIRSMVADAGDGTYLVRLGANFYRVDADLPTGGAWGTSPRNAGLGAQNSLWVAIVEKAYAHFRTNGANHSYRSLDNGDSADAARAFNLAGVGQQAYGTLPTTTGGIATFGTAAALGNQIRAQWNAGRIVTVGTGTVPAGSQMNASHCWAVTGFTTDAAGNVSTVNLRNPWGSDLTVSVANMFAAGVWVTWGTP